MFGYKNLSPKDLIQFWLNTAAKINSQGKNDAQIFPLIEQKGWRQKDELTRINRVIEFSKMRIESKKNLKLACRQLQVSTRPNSGMKPKHTGSYAIIA